VPGIAGILDRDSNTDNMDNNMDNNNHLTTAWVAMLTTARKRIRTTKEETGVRIPGTKITDNKTKRGKTCDIVRLSEAHNMYIIVA